MNQQKIGSFLKQLRLDKGITQQQLANKLNVSNRTVSRLETGMYVPELSILIKLSKFYHVDMIELLNGERNSIKTDEDTLKAVIEYDKAKKQNLKMRIIHISIGIIIILVLSIIIQSIGGLGFFMSESLKNMMIFLSGMLFGSLLLNGLYLVYLWHSKKINELLRIF